MSRIKDKNSRTNKKEAAMQFFINKGYAPEHAAGIVANLIAESGLDHTIGTGDQGNAYGLAQWNIKGSPERYSNFEKLFNKSLYESTFEEQLEYIDWELNNTEKRAMSKLLKTTNPMDAALVVSEFYERPYGARGRSIEQIREQYRKEAEKGIKAYHHNPEREQYATDLYLNYDDNIYAINEHGDYITLNPNEATEQDIQNSKAIKTQFYNEYLTNLQSLEETPNFAPQEDTFFVSNNEDVVPIQNITNNYYYESNDSEQSEEKPNEVTEAKKKLNERQFLVDLINSGALNLQNPEYNIVPQMYRGGQIPTSSQGLYEYPNQTVKVPTKDGRITMKNIPYPVVGISAETGEQILMYPNQEYQFKNTKNVIEIPLSHYNTNKNMQEGGNISYETTVPILQADGSIIYENVIGQGYTFDNGGYVNRFENGGGIDPIIQAKKRKIRDERYNAIQQRDNTSRIVNRYDPNKMASDEWVANKKRNELIEKTGEIVPHTPQSFKDKSREVILNPMTAITHLTKHGRIPDNMSKGERNPYDYAMDIVNPAWYAESAKDIVEGVDNKDISQVGYGAFGLLPFMKGKSIKLKAPKPKSNFKGVKNLSDVIDLTTGSKTIKNVDNIVDPTTTNYRLPLFNKTVKKEAYKKLEDIRRVKHKYEDEIRHNIEYEPIHTKLDRAEKQFKIGDIVQEYYNLYDKLGQVKRKLHNKALPDNLEQLYSEYPQFMSYLSKQGYINKNTKNIDKFITKGFVDDFRRSYFRGARSLNDVPDHLDYREPLFNPSGAGGARLGPGRYESNSNIIAERFSRTSTGKGYKTIIEMVPDIDYNDPKNVLEWLKENVRNLEFNPNVKNPKITEAVYISPRTSAGEAGFERVVHDKSIPSRVRKVEEVTDLFEGHNRGRFARDAEHGDLIDNTFFLETKKRVQDKYGYTPKKKEIEEEIKVVKKQLESTREERDRLIKVINKYRKQLENSVESGNEEHVYRLREKIEMLEESDKIILDLIYKAKDTEDLIRKRSLLGVAATAVTALGIAINNIEPRTMSGHRKNKIEKSSKDSKGQYKISNEQVQPKLDVAKQEVSNRYSNQFAYGGPIQNFYQDGGEK